MPGQTFALDEKLWLESLCEDVSVCDFTKSHDSMPLQG